MICNHPALGAVDGHGCNHLGNLALLIGFGCLLLGEHGILIRHLFSYLWEHVVKIFGCLSHDYGIL